MPNHYDVAVLGLGAMGSMAALELARRGRSVIGFDRFRPPHTLGSSHGLSRIIREAYAEAPQYVPLVRRAFVRWAELEAETGRTLLTPTGGLMVGPPDCLLVSGARTSAVQYQLSYEELDAAQLMKRYPAYQVPSHFVGLLEHRAGVLNPEAGIATALELAEQRGAELHFDEPAERWDSGKQLTITTARGTYTADRLILAAGAWMPEIMQVDVPLTPTRQIMFWFKPPRHPEWFGPDRFPIFLLEWDHDRSIYGFPDQGAGVKVAVHHEGAPVDPNRVDRTVHADDARQLTELIARFFPAAASTPVQSAVCLYTNTQDEHFVIDRHPADDRVVVCSACSGHGYKFAPAMGEILADLALTGQSVFDLSSFRITRPELRSQIVHPSHRK